jgi:hypothetical protein
MFRSLARRLTPPAQVFDVHPLQLGRWLDEAWTGGALVPDVGNNTTAPGTALDVGDGVNGSFREKWTELLRQVWLGMEDAKNGIGPNATDREYIASLCEALRDMMSLRRRGGLQRSRGVQLRQHDVVVPPDAGERPRPTGPDRCRPTTDPRHKFAN